MTADEPPRMYEGIDPVALQLVLAAYERNGPAFSYALDGLSARRGVRLLRDLAELAAYYLSLIYDAEGREPERCHERAIGHLEEHLRVALDEAAGP